jgi:anhydro-N-acetylmuramic acid kinase
MIVAGIMSGTSADGIDVAIVDIRGTAKTAYPKLKLLAHESFPYPAALRKAVLAAMNAQSTTTAELGRLNWRLGLAYADAVQKTLQRHPLKLELIGCHGQTLYHQATPQPYAGQKFACTWQADEPALIASKTGVPVVSNFRPADIAAGGQGAPLVPLFDYVYFRHPTRARVLQNIGGIANMTLIPPAAQPSDCIAFDSGPGNMIIDALMLTLYGKSYDRNGATARRGKILEPVLQQALRHKFFTQKPPKTAGREEFGREFSHSFLNNCRKYSNLSEDALTTATVFTAQTIASAYLRFCTPRIGSSQTDFIVSGGGTHNGFLMDQLVSLLPSQNCNLASINTFGLPPEAKEAAAFALLAWQTWHRRPGNLPSATGAARPVILGQITYV